MVTMLGWFSADADLASWMKRCFRAGFESFRGQNFEGDATVEMAVDGLIHHTHTAFTEFGDDFKMREFLACHGPRRMPSG